jgi:hypothetical protein
MVAERGTCDTGGPDGRVIGAASYKPINPFPKMYTIRDNAVFHYDVKVEGANAAKFIAYNNSWAKDDKKVFFKCWAKRVKDHQSFEALNECYGRDKFLVYVNGKKLEKADCSSFEVLDAGTAPLPFIALSNVHQDAGYAKDKNAVYYQNISIKGADQHSFQSLRNRFGIDSKSVYYEGKNLHVKDIASWRPITQVLSCDRYAVYFCNRLIKGADPRTIWLLLPLEDNYFRDHARFYSNDFVISSRKYYEEFQERISYYNEMLSLFRKGDYFSTMFRRSAPLNAEIIDQGQTC